MREVRLTFANDNVLGRLVDCKLATLFVSGNDVTDEGLLQLDLSSCSELSLIHMNQLSVLALQSEFFFSALTLF